MKAYQVCLEDEDFAKIVSIAKKERSNISATIRKVMVRGLEEYDTN